MKRIDTATRAEDLFGAGKDGFRNSNKGAGIAATQVDADWCNHIQEELANVVEGTGIALDPGDRTQLKAAIKRMIEGLDYKSSVRVASTAAINLAAPGANIDGIAMVVGDRFLEKDHGTAALRGIYIWNGAAVPATRALDFDEDAEVTSGLTVAVEQGTINADSRWQLTTDGAIIVGTTGLTFQNVFSNLQASTTEVTNETVTAKYISPDRLLYSSRVAKAWLRFQGSGTVTIKKALNISSVTDRGVGQWTANFTSAMADANYSYSGMAKSQGTGVSSSACIDQDFSLTPTTTAFQFVSKQSGTGAYSDPDDACIQIFD
jgi:hypothetical protein